MALLLALSNLAQLYLDPIHDVSLTDRAILCLRNYAMLSSSLAAVLVLCYRPPPRNPLLGHTPSVDHEHPSVSDSQSTRNSWSSRDTLSDHARLDVSELFPDADPVLFRHMQGPSSHCSSRSGETATTLSISRSDHPIRPGVALPVARIWAQLRPEQRRNDSTLTQVGGES